MTIRRWMNMWMDMAVPITVVGSCLSLPLAGITWFFFGDAIDNWRHQRKFNAALWRTDVWDSEQK